MVLVPIIISMIRRTPPTTPPTEGNNRSKTSSNSLHESPAPASGSHLPVHTASGLPPPRSHSFWAPTSPFTQLLGSHLPVHTASGLPPPRSHSFWAPPPRSNNFWAPTKPSPSASSLSCSLFFLVHKPRLRARLPIGHIHNGPNPEQCQALSTHPEKPIMYSILSLKSFPNTCTAFETVPIK